MTDTERREYDRYQTQIRCKIGLKYGKVLYGFVQNLSTGGAEILVYSTRLSELVKEGDIISLLIKDVVTTKIKCEVRWISGNRIGVKFLKVDKNFPYLLSTYAMPHIPDIYFR